MQQIIGESGREVVACRVAIELANERVKAAAGRRFYHLSRDGAGNTVRCLGLGDQPLHRRQALIHGAFQYAEPFPKPAQRTGAFHLARKHQPAARALWLNLDAHFEVAHRAVQELPNLQCSPVLLPLAEAFFPF